ncbi:hypothetical protein [Phenylobacterium sp.]|jgi:type VI protein secretion system component VasK|uniref:hypothetical protein n=1 Tax=Phenylobacterium sp. TaxID=1871053 RepID=UPI003D2A412C
MSSVPAKDRRVAAVRIMAAVSVVLAIMCVTLAWAWTEQREEAACWRIAAEFQRIPESDCRGSFWASRDATDDASPPP